MRQMADSVDVAALPAGLPMYAGYVDGHYETWTALVQRFASTAGVILVSITVTDRTVADVLDVEKGDATPTQAPPWCEMIRHLGGIPTVYCSESAWPAVREAFTALQVAEPSWWIAAYPGIGQQLYPTTVAHQYEDTGTYDLSVVADHWPGIDPPPPSPPNPTEDTTMQLYATNSAGTGFVIAADLTHKTGLQDGADAAALLATGLYKTVKLTDAQIAAIPG